MSASIDVERFHVAAEAMVDLIGTESELFDGVVMAVCVGSGSL